MKRFLLFTLLILFASVCFAGDLTTIEKDSFDIQKISYISGFEKVEIDGITAFTSKDFEKENIFIATDSLFYGSKDGVVDLWIDTFANFPPTVADTITAAAKPTLTAQQTNSDTTLTGWTTSLTAGEWIMANVDSASTLNTIVLIITYERI